MIQEIIDMLSTLSAVLDDVWDGALENPEGDPLVDAGAYPGDKTIYDNAIKLIERLESDEYFIVHRELIADAQALVSMALEVQSKSEELANNLYYKLEDKGTPQALLDEIGNIANTLEEMETSAMDQYQIEMQEILNGESPSEDYRTT